MTSLEKEVHHWFLDRYYVVLDYPGSRLPWRVYYRGAALTRSHGGVGTEWRRFGSAETAKRWVEKRLSRHRRQLPRPSWKKA